MTITNGDIIRHCTDEELAEVILYKCVGMVLQVLEAKGDHADVIKFRDMFEKYKEPLIAEQAEWLGKEANLAMR